MSTTRRTFEMGVREYVRTPVLLALLVFLPAYFVLFFTRVVPDQPVAVAVPSAGTMQVATTTAVSVLLAPMATALVAGIAGLFLMQSAREVDGRFALVGAGVPEILLARFGVLALVAAVSTLVSVGALAVTHVPESPAWFLVAVAIAGLTYGGVGAIVGLVLNRLAGVYVLMFGPLLDIFLAQSPFAAETHAIAPYLPGYYSMRLAFDAAFTAGIDPATLAGGIGYLLAIGLVACGAFYRAIRVS
jgi:ABC-2 type transport system permease protein